MRIHAAHDTHNKKTRCGRRNMPDWRITTDRDKITCGTCRGLVAEDDRENYEIANVEDTTEPAPVEDVSEIARVAEIAQRAFRNVAPGTGTREQWREAVRAVWRDSEAKRRDGETEAVRAVLVPEASPTVAECDHAYAILTADGAIASSIAASLQHDRDRAARVDSSRDNAMKWLVSLSVETGVSVKDIALVIGELMSQPGHRLNVDGLK